MQRHIFQQDICLFPDPSIQGSVCSGKAPYSKNHLNHHIVSSVIISICQMVKAILEHRQKDFMVIISIQNFPIPCQGLFSSPSPKLLSNLLKLCTELTNVRLFTDMKLDLLVCFLWFCYFFFLITRMLISKSLSFKGIKNSNSIGNFSAESPQILTSIGSSPEVVATELPLCGSSEPQNSAQNLSA